MYQEGNWQAALDDYEKAREIDPNGYSSWNNIAMLLAACPDDEIRNGAKAVECAQKASELTEWSHPAVWNTLAVAYAELGDWQATVAKADPDKTYMTDLRLDMNIRRITR